MRTRKSGAGFCSWRRRALHRPPQRLLQIKIDLITHSSSDSLMYKMAKILHSTPVSASFTIARILFAYSAASFVRPKSAKRIASRNLSGASADLILSSCCLEEVLVLAPLLPAPISLEALLPPPPQLNNEENPPE